MDRDSWTLDQDSFIIGCVRFQMKDHFRKKENIQINLIDVNVKLCKNDCLRAAKYTTCNLNYLYSFPPCQSGFKHLNFR